jgi:SSS family solute:Na+ symporter
VDRLPFIDLAILVVYLVATVGLGCWFGFRKPTTDTFMAGGRSLPGWAVGLSMFGSYVSSISFLANPGKSFATNWNAFVFSLATPVAALVAVHWFVPFFRRSGEISAYQHLERRFGPWARSYAVICYLLTQMSRSAAVVYLLALAVSPLTGWSVTTVILLTGTIMIIYSIFGGIEAVVWIGVVQSVVLLLGPFVCIVAILALIPGGVASVVDTAAEFNKFSFGSMSLTLDEPTFWVVLMYGLTINLGIFAVDQSYVQRYISTPDMRQAKRSVWVAAALYVPTAAVFFFIGTALFALHSSRPELFPATLDAHGRPDEVFPYFIAHQLPIGMSGLVIAAIFAASMDSSLSSMATLTLSDCYKRYFRPQANERESMWVLQSSTLIWGILSTVVALTMIHSTSALDVRWHLAGIFSGGVLGLFLLGLISHRADNATAIVATAGGVLVIGWMSLSPTPYWPAALNDLRSPFHGFLVTVVGTLTILVVGIALALVRPKAAALRQIEVDTGESAKQQ